MTFAGSGAGLTPCAGSRGERSKQVRPHDWSQEAKLVDRTQIVGKSVPRSIAGLPRRGSWLVSTYRSRTTDRPPSLPACLFAAGTDAGTWRGMVAHRSLYLPSHSSPTAYIASRSGGLRGPTTRTDRLSIPRYVIHPKRTALLPGHVLPAGDGACRYVPLHGTRGVARDSDESRTGPNPEPDALLPRGMQIPCPPPPDPGHRTNKPVPAGSPRLRLAATYIHSIADLYGLRSGPSLHLRGAGRRWVLDVVGCLLHVLAFG